MKLFIIIIIRANKQSYGVKQTQPNTIPRNKFFIKKQKSPDMWI